MAVLSVVRLEHHNFADQTAKYDCKKSFFFFFLLLLFNTIFLSFSSGLVFGPPCIQSGLVSGRANFISQCTKFKAGHNHAKCLCVSDTMPHEAALTPRGYKKLLTQLKCESLQSVGRCPLLSRPRITKVVFGL